MPRGQMTMFRLRPLDRLEVNKRIHFSSCTNGSIGWSYWSIVLEEGTDHIYIVDQRNTSGEGALSVGIQIDATTAISDPASPWMQLQVRALQVKMICFTHSYMVHKLKMK